SRSAASIAAMIFASIGSPGAKATSIAPALHAVAPAEAESGHSAAPSATSAAESARIKDSSTSTPHRSRRSRGDAERGEAPVRYRARYLLARARPKHRRLRTLDST